MTQLNPDATAQVLGLIAACTVVNTFMIFYIVVRGK